ncbi:MAG: preprotein translocase subunit SecE [Candidatus Harrisonbacteria bacterium CG10_big_fil_rev_8_21_14_0_10_42_17]|uniref:Protein translocase subunit SecE n=1 Tax=Candidatus Harrisonbacteria bacterium CG10_big_fil_rev_8_21_14_0_10_42_17 TaxID=1974584 RepID=A0A2M6WGU9_9BACT|nr:MAG: preprotein translocase subunit SecE [Candidatus Harrisonbacteria bacterium CG10_big_fil_rev_8_21_14_0_10_42_17]
MTTRIKLFFQESKQEFKRINWPTFKETRTMTIIVIAFSLVIAAFLGILDTIFIRLLKIIAN